MRYRKLLTSLLILFIASCAPKPEIVPSPIPTNTKTSIPSSPTPEILISQPVWFKNPNTNILMLTNPDMAIFIDPVSMDDVWLEFKDARWIDNSYVGSSPYYEPRCPAGEAYRYLFNLSMWKIENAFQNPRDLSKFCFSEISGGVTRSQETSLMIYNNNTNVWEKFLDVTPDQTIYDFTKIAEKAYVLRSNKQRKIGNTIIIYEIKSRKALKSYVGEVKNNIIRYSSKLQKIAYISNNNLCFIDLQNLKRECETDFRNIYEDMRLGNFLSSGDLPFSYDTSPHVNYNIRKVCVLRLLTGEIKCPTGSLEILNPRVEYKDLSPGSNEKYEINKTWSVIDTKFSPDETWLAICYGLDFPNGYLGLAFVDINGKNFNVINSSFSKHFPPFCDQYRPVYSYSKYSWRPIP
jgi:hypothetical protein